MNADFSDRNPGERMGADPFEEFEFRPLTEGLGFHKKTESPKFELKNNLPEIEMPALSPAKRNQSEPTSAPSASSVGSVDEILRTLQNKRQIDFKASAQLNQQNQTTTYRASAPDISALILDSMLVIAASLACLIILTVTTQVDLFSVLTQNSDNVAIISLFALVGACSWIYLTINRMFLGFTPGEWVFDQRVGRPEEQPSAPYQLRVLLRSTIVVATGLFLLPAISMILNQDFAGMISGAQLVKKA